MLEYLETALCVGIIAVSKWLVGFCDVEDDLYAAGGIQRE